jgi:hypothetical protein
MVTLDVLTFNCFSYFSYNVLFEVDSILQFKWFASHCPSSLLFCHIIFVMKKMVWCCPYREDLHEPNLWLACLSSWKKTSKNSGLMKGVAMLTYDDEMENKVCVGCLCFLQQHSNYFPLCFYQQIHGRVDVLFCFVWVLYLCYCCCWLQLIDILLVGR